MTSARAPQHSSPAVRLGRLAGLVLVLGSLLALAPRARANIRIDEFGIRCSNGATNTAFVELSGTIDDYFENTIGLVFLGASGDTLADLRPIFGHYAGSYFYYSNKFLLTAPGFHTYNSTTGNAPLAVEPDPVRGRVILYRQLTATTRSILHQLPYGGPGEVPAPPNGATIVRVSANTFAVTPDGTPQGYLIDVPAENCFRLPHWSVNEVAVTCWDGGTTAQFLELRHPGPVGVLDAGYHLRLYDHVGALQADIANPFGALAGTAISQPRSFLLGSAALGPDVTLPVTLDPAGGRAELATPANTPGTVVSAVTWSGAPASPRPGTSLSLSEATGLFESTFPSPTRFDGGTPTTTDCYYDAPASGGAWISELATQCADGGAEGGFVELTAGLPVPPDPRFELVAEDHAGQPLGATRLFDHRTGSGLLTGMHMLFGAPGFGSAAGLAPDRTLPFTLDPLGGRVSVAIEDALTGVLGPIVSVAYGGSAPLPGPGQSLVADAIGWHVTDFPTPTRIDGASSNGSPCLPDHSDRALQIGETMTRCRSVEGSSFVELLVRQTAVVTDRFRLRHWDHAGTLAWDQPHLLADFVSATLPVDSRLLFVTAAGAAQMGPGDVPLVQPLDPAGGRLQLLVDGFADGVPRVADEIAWGTAAQPAPAPGTSLEHAAGGAWTTSALPTPTRFPSIPLSLAFSTCLGECQPNLLRLESYPPSEWRLAPVRDDLGTLGTGHIDQVAGIMHVTAKGRSTVDGFFGDDFTLEGPPVGTTALVRVRWNVTAGFSTVPPRFQRGLVHVSLAYRDRFGGLDTQEFDLTPGTQVFDRVISVVAGRPFQLTARVLVHGALQGVIADSSAFGRAMIEFPSLPTGDRITSCWGFESGPPVAVEIALAEGRVEPGVAHLRWFAADERPHVTVERCGATGEWMALGETDADGQGYYAWDDTGIEAGARYGWRLAWTEAGVRRTTPTAWFDVPFGVSFALRGVRPIPTVGASALAFALDRPGDVRADVIDIAGRRVLERRWPALPAGEHSRPLAREGELAPGVYLVRLSHGGRVLHTRMIVTR